MFLFLLVDTECSGRSLATLLVVWVGAAMVASVLLRWKYMWIVLAVLTLLFLLACGYTAYNAKRAHERSVARENDAAARLELSEGAVNTEISTVSGRLNNEELTAEPPRYQADWLTADLPPSYASIINEQSTFHRSIARSLSQRSMATTRVTECHNERSFPGPPPYSIIVQERRVSSTNSDTNNVSINEHIGSVSVSLEIRASATPPTSFFLAKEQDRTLSHAN